MINNPTLFDSVPLTRTNDHYTSIAGAQSVKLRRIPQAMTLLGAYYDAPNGLTDDEAGIQTGLAAQPKCCYWKRCSELRTLGYIEKSDNVRFSTASHLVMVCYITTKGAKALNDHQETL